MNKGRLTAAVIVIVVILAGALTTFYYLYDKEQKDPEVFETAKAEVRDIAKKSVATGSVVPRKEIEVKPQISGIISELMIEAGQIVTEGTPIARVKIIPNITSLSNAENRVNRAKISLGNAEIDFNRNVDLLDKGVIAPVTLQQFEMGLNNANEELNAARDNLQIVKNGVSSRSKNATNTVIKATNDGMVLSVPVEQGNSVIEANNFNDGTTIATIANMRDLIFLGQIDESEVEELEIGMDLILSIGAIENKSYVAKLEYISPKGIEENGAIQFEIKAAITLEEKDFIRAGYSANADIVLEERKQVLAISESLLQYKKRKAFVEVKTGDDTWEVRDVKTGLSNGMYVEILEGITKDDEIKVWNQVASGPGGGKKYGGH